ncbi:MAG: serine hydrolase, partial [Candidatus Competibacterales bacterium]|nr:serine hydrolase [Candidatus Competibacterales bacterium]
MTIALLMLAASLGLATESSSPEWPYCGNVEHYPGDAWGKPAVRPGWNAEALKSARSYFDSLDSAAVMVVHRGHLIAGWGDVEDRYDMASLRKSVLSALYGRLVTQGSVDLEKTLADLGIEESDRPLSQAEKRATVRDLISARSGILRSAHYEMGGWKRLKSALTEWASSEHGQSFLPSGQTWLYNNWDFNVAAVALERQAGIRTGPAFAQYVAAPLGMQDFRAGDVTYVGNESYAERRMGNLSDHPAYMFTMSTRDIARIGVLYLGCGQWDGKPLIQEKFVLDSIR